jgi:glycosyl transferase family 25
MIWFILIFILFIVFIIFTKKEGFTNKSIESNVMIYWINLDRSSDRREKIKKMLETIDISNQRISAIDGKNEKMYDIINTNNYDSTDSEYGCLMSHLEAIRIFKESTHNIALILEDDCTLELKKYWKMSLNEKINEIVLNSPKDWEVIMLSYIVNTNHPINNWSNNDKYIRYDGKIYSTLAYIINKKGAKKLIDDCDNLSCYKDNMYLLNSTAEHKADHYIYKNTITYCYKYPVFIYANEDSTIHDDHLDFHKQNKERIIKNYQR